MPLISCSELHGGDILLKIADGTLFNQFIQSNQSSNELGPYKIAHAAISSSPYECIEAQSSGITCNDLRVQDKAYSYVVYRAKDSALGKKAAELAKELCDIHQKDKNLTYNTLGAWNSRNGGPSEPKTKDELNKLFQSLEAGQQLPFFCSQFVTFVYQCAAVQLGKAPGDVLPMNDAKVPPATLAKFLVGSGSFVQVGGLKAGQR